MPYTRDEQRKLLAQYGLNSDEYEIIPQEEYFGRTQPTPAAISTPPSNSGALGAATRGFKRSLLPSLTGLGTTAAISAGLRVIPHPVPQILGWTLPLLGGLGAGYGTAALQEKIKPTTPEEAAQREADVKEHPMASVVGELIPSLAALKPNLRGVIQAFKKLPAAGVDDAARAAVLAQRLNLGLGAGLGALSEVGIPLARGEDISPGRAVAATLGGALLNEPHALGRKLFRLPSSTLRPSMGGERSFPGVPVKEAGLSEAGQHQGTATYQSEVARLQQLGLSRADAMRSARRNLEAIERQVPRQPGPTGEFPGDITEQVVHERFTGEKGPSVGEGESVPIREIREGTVLDPRRLLEQEPDPHFEQRIKIEALEREVSELDAQIRHLPLEERLPQQAALDEAKVALAKEKANIAAEQRASRVLFISPKGETVSPKPEIAATTPKEVMARETRTAAQKAEAKAKNLAALEEIDKIHAAELAAALGRTKKKGPSNAPNPKPQPVSGKPKYPRVSQGKNVPANKEKVRQEEGKQAGGGSGVLGGQEVEGWTISTEPHLGVFKANDPNLTPEMKAALPKNLEVTDKRPDSITKGYTVYIPEGATPKQMLGAIKAKTAEVLKPMIDKLRTQLGLTEDEIVKLLQAKTPFERGMNLLVALQSRGIPTQVLKHTPKGHRLAIEQALKAAGEDVEKIIGQKVSFKAGPEDAGGAMAQVESELAKAPLETLLQHPNNRKVFELLKSIGARAGIETGIEPSLVDDAGQVALGMAHFKDRLVKLNANILAEDTLAHEVSHILLRDMILNDDPMAMRGLALFQGSEEQLTQAMGTRLNELAHMQVEGLTMKRFTEWVKDFISSIKARWGNATEDDFRRLLARRILKGDHQPAKIVVSDPKEVAYQKLVNDQQDKREGLEASLAGRNVVVDTGIPGIRSVVDRVRNEAHPMLADAFEKTAKDIKRYQGRLTDFGSSGVETLTPAEQVEATKYAYEMKDTKGNPGFTPSDKVLDWWEKSLRPFLHRAVLSAKEIGKQIQADGGRDIYETPYYFPEMLREDIQDLLLNRPNTPEAAKYREAIIKHNAAKQGISYEQADAQWNNRGHAEFVKPNEGLLEYGPLSRPAGIGLPPEVREDDLNRIITRYGNRAATALAWHKNVVGNPEVAYLAGVRDQAGNEVPKPSTMPMDAPRLGTVPIVSEATKLLKGDFTSSDRKFDSISRAVKSGMMQTLTGMVDLSGWWAQTLPYIHPSQIPTLVRAHGNLVEGIRAGREMGVIQQRALHMQSIVDRGEMSGAHGLVNFFNNISDMFNKYTGRDLLERVTRGLTMWTGQALALSNVGHVFNPNTPRGLRNIAIRFLDRFADDKNWATTMGDLVKTGQPVPDEFINRTAANFVDAAQGTYDIRGLPLGALKGELSPFLALAKWNIEKANEFKKAVWNPLMRGNVTPLLITTGGMLLGGTAIEQVREWMTKRKGAQAKWEEIAEGGGKGLIYRIMALSSYIGFAGIVTELAKQGMDLVEGRPVSGFRFPAIAFITDTAERLSQAAYAVKNGENLLSTFGVDLPLQLLKDNIQMARIGLNHTVDREQVKKANQLRDLRVFREMQGLPIQRWTSEGRNPFTSRLEHQFEQAESVPEAVQMAGQLRRQALERGVGPSGVRDPERVRSLLNSYRTPSSNVAPSITSNPRQFMAYMNWVRQTQGEETARTLLTEYLRKERMDKLKAGLIPSLSTR